MSLQVGMSQIHQREIVNLNRGAHPRVLARRIAHEALLFHHRRVRGLHPCRVDEREALTAGEL